MYDFFFLTEEAFLIAMERLRRSDRNWLYNCKDFLISFYEGSDADFLVGELALMGIGGGAYRLVRPDKKKGGTEIKDRVGIK